MNYDNPDNLNFGKPRTTPAEMGRFEEGDASFSLGYKGNDDLVDIAGEMNGTDVQQFSGPVNILSLPSHFL